MPATFAEDVKAIEVAQGVLTCEGGYASHAPVVARSLGKVALVQPDMKIEAEHANIGGKTVKEGDYVTLNVPYYEPPGRSTWARSKLITPSAEGSGLFEFLDIVQKHIDDFDVHANADQPRDADVAKLFKAKGIGLCRTEHMFFHEKRINNFRAMIIAGSKEEGVKALSQLEEMQVADFYKLFKIMEGLPGHHSAPRRAAPRIPPPHQGQHGRLHQIHEGAATRSSPRRKSGSGATCSRSSTRCSATGACRVAITYPEIYDMQTRAIFEAAYMLRKEGIKVVPEIMIPIVMSAIEIKFIRNGKKIEGKSIKGIKDIKNEVREEYKAIKIEYRVGTMIELPAAALQAGQDRAVRRVLQLRHQRPHPDHLRALAGRLQLVLQRLQRVRPHRREPLQGARRPGEGAHPARSRAREGSRDPTSRWASAGNTAPSRRTSRS